MEIQKKITSFLGNKYFSRWVILLLDLIIISAASSLSYLLSIQIYMELGVVKHLDFITFFFITFCSSLFSFILLKTYKGIVRYSTIREIRIIFLSSIFTSLFVFITLYGILSLSGNVSFAYCSIFFLNSFAALFVFRVVVVYLYQRWNPSTGANNFISVHIWDANEQDLSFAQTTNALRNNFKIKGFAVKKQNLRIKQFTSLPVFDKDDDESIAHYNVENILFTDQNLVKCNIKQIEKILTCGIQIFIVQLKNINCIESLQNDISRHFVRPLQIEDLLCRSEIAINLEYICRSINTKTILVTGAAGSIGSEIVRQLAAFDPKLIVCFDQAETPLNDLEIEIKEKFTALKFITIIGDIRDKEKLIQVFNDFNPDVIYHAAAYKHVPMMEKFPCEAILTNVYGTKNLADLALKYNIEKFVMVSTDKAVNPTNIMGASKRIAEIYTQSIALQRQNIKAKTKFITTRFGNVLGSNGSVVPFFQKQIEAGGPVTVTHPDITRYFMTILEACRLVLEASYIGESGYIYVFDMGEPVRIYDMAIKMIELTGLKPQEDIKVEFSGLRTGEKLYEELLSNSELTIPTSHEKVMIAKVKKYDFEEIRPIIEDIIMQARAGNDTNLVTSMKKLVPEFISKNSKYEYLDLYEKQDHLHSQHNTIISQKRASR